ncbi:MAG: hypothetical protein ACFBQW_02315 [Sphingomonadaceae bacterium]
MADPLLILVIAAASLAAVAIAVLAGLKAWTGWLELKRLELERGRESGALPSPASRIDIADLKERVRKLEAIAAGVE